MLTVTNNTIWCSLSSSEVIHILNKDDLEQNEFVISGNYDIIQTYFDIIHSYKCKYLNLYSSSRIYPRMAY